MSAADVVLLPVLDADNIAEGVNWNAVSRLIEVVRKSGKVSKDVRYSLKARIKCKDFYRILNTLTVLHTISLNCNEGVRDSMVHHKFHRMLKKLTRDKNTEILIKLSIAQIIADWIHIFRNEKLGVKSVRFLKHIKRAGIVLPLPSPCAVTKLNDMLLGIPALAFIKGIDFSTTDILPLANNRRKMNRQKTKSGILPSSIKKLKRIFSNTPSFSIISTTTDIHLLKQSSTESSQRSRASTPVSNYMDDIPVALAELCEITSYLQLREIEIVEDETDKKYLESGVKLAEKLAIYQQKIQMAVSMHVEGFVSEISGIRVESEPTTTSGQGTEITVTSKLLDAGDSIKRALEEWEKALAASNLSLSTADSHSMYSEDIMSTTSSFNDSRHNSGIYSMKSIEKALSTQNYIHSSTSPFASCLFYTNENFTFPPEALDRQDNQSLCSVSDFNLQPSRDDIQQNQVVLVCDPESADLNIKNNDVNIGVEIIQQKQQQQQQKEREKRLMMKARRTYSDPHGFKSMPPALRVRLTKMHLEALASLSHPATSGCSGN